MDWAQSIKADIQMITSALKVILEPGQVTELRALDAVTRFDKRPHVESGYFDDVERLALAAADLQNAKGIYFIPNPVLPSLLARANNRIRRPGTEPTTSDADIVRRRWLLIDVDPVRPSGISSTDSEHLAALQCGEHIRAFLTARGWPEPLFADSGNGAHLLYRIEEPCDDSGLIHSVLEGLSVHFTNDVLKIDQGVANPARIWKLYGTPVRKGDNTKDRPHRLSRIIELPPALTGVTTEQMWAVARPNDSVELSRRRHIEASSFDLEAWIKESRLDAIGPKDWKDGRIWILPVCPWNSSHSNKSAFIVQTKDGAVAAGCHHDSCNGKTWSSLKDVVAGRVSENRRNITSRDAQPGAGSQRDSRADRLVDLARDATLFHTPGVGSDGFATIRVDSHFETWPIKSKGFRLWLCQQHWSRYRKAPNTQAIKDALEVLAARAIYEGPETPVSVRVAEQDGVIWVDLCNERWETVRITSEGWFIESNSPVKFIRHRGMLPLPAPRMNGSIGKLREFLNLPDEDSWILFVSCLLAHFRPGKPFPILVVNGEQGSAKSTACRVARQLIDPNTAPLRRPPKDERDLMIAACNSWMLAFDNLSGIPAWLSDTLCTVATGGGFATRELYSDSEETLFTATRPVLINGIEDLTSRSDLLDRSIVLVLPQIIEEHRKNEGEFWAEFESARPCILGAIFDAVSVALRNYGNVELPRKPRMADFAMWVAAAEPALPWQKGRFMKAYTENQRGTSLVAVESAAIAPALLQFMENRLDWNGTATELLTELTSIVDQHLRERREWPSNPRKFSGDLRRLAPDLRCAGINVTFAERTGQRRIVVLENTWSTPSQSSPPSDFD